MEMPTDLPDPYAALGIPSDTTATAIRTAYRRRAFETHPDRHGGDAAEFLRVKAAYETLANPSSRALAESLWAARPLVTPAVLSRTLAPRARQTCSITIENRGPRVSPLVVSHARSSYWQLVAAPASIEDGSPGELIVLLEAAPATLPEAHCDRLAGRLGEIPWAVEVIVRIETTEPERRNRMRTLDLNELRDRVLGNQQNGDTHPISPDKRIVVDADGRLVRGEDAAQHPERVVSEVPQHVFSFLDLPLAWRPTRGSRQTVGVVPQTLFNAAPARRAAESAIVAEAFPRGTRLLEVDGTEGWLYPVTSELGDEFQLFAYFDHGLYFVQVVSPVVEGRYGAHDAHLYPSGIVCLVEGGGLPSLRDAYAKSVLWANGFSIFRRAGRFPFSANNA